MHPDIDINDVEQKQRKPEAMAIDTNEEQETEQINALQPSDDNQSAPQVRFVFLVLKFQFNGKTIHLIIISSFFFFLLFVMAVIIQTRDKINFLLFNFMLN